VQTPTSDPESSLSRIAVALLQDGALVYCIENSTVYRYDLNSAATADGDRIVDPVTGPGQWVKTPNPSLLKGQIVVPVTELTQNSADTVTATLTGAQVGDALALSPTADLPNALAVSWARVSAPDVVTVRMANVATGTVVAATYTFDVGVVGSLPS
jgi:hypothetical protein